VCGGGVVSDVVARRDRRRARLRFLRLNGDEARPRLGRQRAHRYVVHERIARCACHRGQICKSSKKKTSFSPHRWPSVSRERLVASLQRCASNVSLVNEDACHHTFINLSTVSPYLSQLRRVTTAPCTER